MDDPDWIIEVRDCLAAVEAALREDAQRAEWHAEMRRDAFGGSV